MSKNKNTVKEFIAIIEKQKPELCGDGYILGYFSSFIESNMTPTMRKKMETHTNYLKELDNQIKN